VTLLLGVLALVAPVAVGMLFLTNPELTASWVDDGSRSVVAALAAMTIGVAMAAALSWILVRLRFGHLVKAAEQIATGDYTVAVSSRGGGLESRLGIAINGISAALADTHDRATVDRLTGVVNRQALLAALFTEVERASRYERPLCIAFVESTISRRSTTRTAMLPAISSCAVSRGPSRRTFARATSSAAMAARSSCSSSRRRTSRTARR
jgi:hypothetical protein